MTPDVIGVIVAVFGCAATLLGGVAGLIARLERRLDARLAHVEAELVEVKIAIARIEGPRPHLLRP